MLSRARSAAELEALSGAGQALADRLAAGGYSLSLVELAQLVQLPIKQLAEKATPWTWRDWMVRPNGDGRWHLERGAAGSEPVIPGT